jgi:HK97 family phage major capsid protein
MSIRATALAEKVEGLRAELLELDAIDAPTDEQVARSTAALAEYDAASADLDAARAYDAKMDVVRAAVANPANRESGFGANVVIKRDPWENPSSVVVGRSRSDQDTVARAVTAISETKYDAFSGVTDATRAQIVEKIENVPGAAAHVLAHGSPAYKDAFMRWGESQGVNVRYSDREAAALDEARAIRTALNITTGSSGQFSLPTVFDPTLIHTGTATVNPIRPISRVVTGTQNVWNGVSVGNVTTYWHAEAAALTDGSPTLSHPVVTAGHLTAWVPASWEFFDDSAMVAQLPGLIGEAFGYAESTAFVSGTGTSSPLGVVTAISATAGSTVTATTRGSFTSASAKDVFAVVNAVTPRYENTSSWIANKATYNTIRQMSSAGYGSLFWGNLTNDVTPNPAYPLLGSPTYNSSDVLSTTTTGTVLMVLGDFSQYLILDVLGTTAEFVQNVVNSSGIPTGQRGMIARKRVGANVTDINAFRFLLA